MDKRSRTQTKQKKGSGSPSASEVRSILHDYFAARRANPNVTPVQFLRSHHPYILGHHPRHEIFRDHVWCMGGLYVCKGCAMTLVGALVGLATLIMTRWHHGFDDSECIAILFGLLTPTVLTAFLRAPGFVRRGARFLLGVCLALAVLCLLTPDTSLTTKCIILVAFFAFKIPLSRRRQRLNSLALPHRTP